VIKRKEFDQNDGINKHRMSDIVGVGKELAVVGVDIYVWFYQALRTKLAAQSHHAVPIIPASSKYH
jgi:hypothetical protein